MKILGVDYGESRTGVAVSDAFGWTAQAVGTINEKDINKAAEKVAACAKEQGAEKIVVGLPKNMDGSEGFRAKASVKFADILGEISGLPVIMWDERLTSVSAARVLDEGNIRGKKRKAVLDTVAATYILQGYLDSIGK